jgi:putative protease
MTSPELLAPAGSMQHIKYAFAYGADAVYAGQPRYSLRVRNNSFSKLEALKEGIDYAHALGKKFYVVSNIAPHNAKLKTYLDDMRGLIALKPDALIMSDPGLIMMVQDEWPDMPIHLSVQANAVNYKTVEFWKRMGLERVILSRELSLEEIEEIHAHCPEMELEVFVHGALCIAYSGRCLLSGYMNHRDPNQGTCTNACRWKYQAHEAKETIEGDIVAVNPIVVDPVIVEPVQPERIDDVVLLQEQTKPGEYMPAYEDEHGTYIMNSKDLRAIEHVERLTQMGIHSLKIEGRTKSHFYVARTVQTYRQAIDLAVKGEKFDPSLMNQLDSLANRGYTEGFYRRHKPQDTQTYESGNSASMQQQFVGEVINYQKGDDYLLIDVKNRFGVGDEIELMTPQGNVVFDVVVLLAVKDNAPIQVAPGSGHKVKIPVPNQDCDYTFALIMKTLKTPLFS